MENYQKMYNILYNSLTDISKIIEHTRHELDKFYTPPDDRPIILYENGVKKVYKNWEEAEKRFNSQAEEDLP